MIDLKKLELDPRAFEKNLENRGLEKALVDDILNTNSKRKKVIAEEEGLKAYQNKKGQKIAQLKREKKNADELLEEMKEISEKVSGLLEKRHVLEKKLRDLLLHMPNLCHPDVCLGQGEEDNALVSEYGHKPDFSFECKDHVALGENLGLLNFDSASQVSGARFVFLKGALAQLERALSQFMLDVHIQENGYEELSPPLMVHPQAMEGTGQLPKFSEEMFHIPSSGHYLIPTSEIPVVNFFGQRILSESELPISIVAHTPCFRAEAGSYGKDTKGMIRQHQFYKVELVKLVHPEKSYEEHEKLTEHAMKLLERLELPFRQMLLSTGDIGFAAAKCYDLEVWLPSQKAYREISSCSNCEDFQSRRAQIRFRPSGKSSKLQFVHTLNGSGLAVGRTLIAIMENFQNEDGSITLPKALHPYMKGCTVIGQ